MLVVEGLHNWPQSSQLALFLWAECRDSSYSLDFEIPVSHIGFSFCLGNVSEFGGAAVMIGVDP